jgi:hypothetical protein
MLGLRLSHHDLILSILGRRNARGPEILLHYCDFHNSRKKPTSTYFLTWYLSAGFDIVLRSVRDSTNWHSDWSLQSLYL